MQNFEPNLDLLRQALGNNVQGFHAELIKIALGWSRVYRVTLFQQGHSTRDTVIIKTVDPHGPPALLEAERELRFYQVLHPQLSVPKPEVYFLTTDAASGFHVIVMEDLAPTHHFPTHPYQWKREELKCVLRAYASLHTQKNISLQYPWLALRHESLLNFETIPEQVAIVQRAGIWAEVPELENLINYAQQSSQNYANEKMALLHGDTTPANAAFPRKLGSQPATLIDWQDAGIGMPEFDLAYLDLQPFDSARLIPRQELLDLYWQFRTEIDSNIPTPAERCDRQLHADVITTLWLTLPASRVALHPYPEGTYPHMHWASQYRIVYNRLKSLPREIHSI